MIKSTDNDETGGKSGENVKNGPIVPGPSKSQKSNSHSKDLRMMFKAASVVDNSLENNLSSSEEAVNLFNQREISNTVKNTKGGK